MSNLPSTESETIEFKEHWTDRALEDLAAFSNHRGGELYVGIRDDGTVVGFGGDGDDEEQQRIANQISDKLHIAPHFDIKEFANKPVLVIRVATASGHLIPYRGRYLTRIGTTNRDMTPEELSRRTLEVTGQTWDTLPSAVGIGEINPNLIREFLELASRRLPRSARDEKPERVLQNLDLTKDGRLTNAGVLLFTAKPQSVYPQARLRIGRFRNSDILDSHDYDGSLWDQLDRAMQRFGDMLEVRFEVEVSQPNLKGLQRQEIWEYPLEALREGLINALIHRDYTAHGDIQVRVYDDHLTIWNPGGLPEGIHIEQLREPDHPSVLRNPLIAQVFYYAGFVERWGTGTTRIIKQCAGQGLPEPEFKESAGGFRVIFGKDLYRPDRLKKIGLTTRQMKIIQVVRDRGEVRLSDLLDTFPDLTDRTIQRELKALVEHGLLRAVGEKKGRSYTPV